jgi:hypothetical protein
MNLCSTKAIQGGTNSAALCQYSVLTMVHPRATPSTPRTISRDNLADVPLDAVDFFALSVAARRCVHVDDVMSGGDTATSLNEECEAMMTRATELYGVRWKPGIGATTSADAVGVRVETQHKTWRLKPSWATLVAQALLEARGRQLTDKHVQWLDGVAEWIALVLHFPALTTTIRRVSTSDTAITFLLQLLKASCRHTQQLTPEQWLRRWPRRNDDYAISDACGRGWAGAVTNGTSVCGRWYKCRRTDWWTPYPCCGGNEPGKPNPEDMYYTETLASVETYHNSLVADRVEDMLLLTDSEIWMYTLQRMRTQNIHMMALIIVMYVIAKGPIAVAHVADPVNTADRPSREIYTFVAEKPPPPHTKLRWSIIGTSKVCHSVQSAAIEAVIPYLPCIWRQRMNVYTSRRTCVQDCGH